MEEDVLLLLRQLAADQEKRLLVYAQRIVERITPDDLLQPNDFPALETHPAFRYEEGILHGIRMAEASFLCLFKERNGE